MGDPQELLYVPSHPGQGESVAPAFKQSGGGGGGNVPIAYAHHPYDNDTQPGMLRCPPYGTTWRNFSPEFSGLRGDGYFGLGVSMWIRMHSVPVNGAGSYSYNNPVFSILQEYNSSDPMFTFQIVNQGGTLDSAKLWYNGGASQYANYVHLSTDLPGTFWEGGWSDPKWFWVYIDIASSASSSRGRMIVCDEDEHIVTHDIGGGDELFGGQGNTVGQIVSFACGHDSQDTTLSRSRRSPIDIAQVRMHVNKTDQGWTNGLSSNWTDNERWKYPINFADDAEYLEGDWELSCGWAMDGDASVMSSSPSYQSGLDFGEENVDFIAAGVDGPVLLGS